MCVCVCVCEVIVHVYMSMPILTHTEGGGLREKCGDVSASSRSTRGTRSGPSVQTHRVRFAGAAKPKDPKGNLERGLFVNEWVLGAVSPVVCYYSTQKTVYPWRNLVVCLIVALRAPAVFP